MSSTIWSGKRVAAFKTDDGVTIYALLAKTHESNVFPQIPRWSCFVIGTYEEVLLTIHEIMRSCEGGSTRSRSGTITPENFLKAWLREFKAPVKLFDRFVEIGWAGTDEVSRSQQAKLTQVLLNAGRSNLIDQVETTKLTFSLFRDWPILSKVYGVDGFASAWNLIDANDVGTIPEPSLAPVLPTARAPAIPTLSALRLGQHNVLVRDELGTWSDWDWDYRAVGAFVLRYGYPVERVASGASAKAVTAFRDLCTNAAPIPADATVHITVAPPDTHDWHIREARDLVSKLCAISADQAENVERLNTTYGDLTRADALRELCSLSAAQVTWTIPHQKADFVAPEPIARTDGLMQLALL